MTNYDRKMRYPFNICIWQCLESRIFLILFKEISPNHWCMVQYNTSSECEETKGKEHVNEVHKEEHCNMQPYDPCDDGKQKINDRKKRRMREREEKESWKVMESIQWLAEVALREVERMKAQAEAKKGEKDLKQTEIIANTQSDCKAHD